MSRFPLRRRAPVAAVVAGALFWLAGCATPPLGDIVTGPVYVPTNVFTITNRLPASLRRVALLPLTASSSQPEIEAGRAQLEPVLRAELTRTRRFEVIPISPEQLRDATGQAAWSAEAELPPTLLRTLASRFGCDAVLFSRLTQYHAYPPLAIGWNLKLVDLSSAAVIWAADEVFDASQSTVANGARLYRQTHSQATGPLADSRQILMSPTAFGRYSAETLLGTLPPR